MHISISNYGPEFKGVVIIPFFENENEYLTNPVFEEVNISNKLFSGKKDSQYLFETQDKSKIFLLVGLGKNPEYKEVQSAFRRLTAKREELFEKEVLLFGTAFTGPDQLEAAVVGLKLGTYRLGHYKNQEKQLKDWNLVNLQVNTSLSEGSEVVKRAEKIALAQIEAFLMVDLPSNKVTPEFLGDWARNTGERLEIKVKVLDKKQAEKEGLYAFLAVGQGSRRESQFIIMEYCPKEAKKHIGLIGKGVTFDTGGLNIKTQGMVHMKCDMGGAATVLAAMQLLADIKVPFKVTAIVPCVENAIDSQSYLPSDVINSFSGKTIEIIDTDAEGRLILADALSYMVKNYKTDHLIDFATLTGSAVGTFGYECAALFSKNEEILKRLQEAGTLVGEKVWPLPMWDTYQKEMDSEIADIKNFHGKPFAGAITAAKFLEFFTNNHPSWAHIDIAGTAFGDSEFAKTKHATAFGVHLLLKFMENL